MLKHLLGSIPGRSSSSRSPQGGQRLQSDKEPRLHHYWFAHRVLPAVFYANPARFMAVLRERGKSLLQVSWERLGSDMKIADRIPADGLNYEIQELASGVTIAIISLPKPQGITEAYFVAPVYRPAMADQEPLAKFFTLEYGMDFDKGSTRTVLCQWTQEKSHMNMGDGPEPVIATFLETIVRHL